MRDLPRISVVIPCYNHESYVADAIESVLSQDYQNLELIVVNDGSTDASRAIVEEMAREHCFTLINQPNAGLTAAVDTGFSVSTGEFFVSFDADDVMLPGRLKLQQEYLSANPQTACCAANYEYIDAAGKRISGAKRKTPGSYKFAEIFSGAIWMGAPTSMYRTQAIRQVGGFDTSISIQDQPMELQLAHAGFSMDIIPDVVTQYRQHDCNMSKAYRDNFPVYLKSIERYRTEPGFLAAKRHLVNSALKRAVIEDKPFARQLFAQLPFYAWDMKTLRRLRQYFCKK